MTPGEVEKEACDEQASATARNDKDAAAIAARSARFARLRDYDRAAGAASKAKAAHAASYVDIERAGKGATIQQLHAVSPTAPHDPTFPPKEVWVAPPVKSGGGSFDSRTRGA